MSDIDVLTSGVRTSPNGALVPVAYLVLDGDHNLLLATGDAAKALRRIRRAESGSTVWGLRVLDHDTGEMVHRQMMRKAKGRLEYSF